MQITVDDIISEGNWFKIEFSHHENLEHIFNFTELKYEYDVNIEDIDESLLLVPFVGNMIPMAWLYGVRVKVPSIDSTFYNQLPNIKSSFEDLYPMIEFDDSGVIDSNTLKQNPDPTEEINENIAQLFTGGVDSLATYVRNADKSPTLISIDADLWKDTNEFEVRKNRISEFAINEGASFHPISTNMYYLMDHSNLEREFEYGIYLSYWENFQLSLSYLTACVPLSSVEGFSKLYIASTYPNDYNFSHGSHPVVDENIKWNHTYCKHDAFDMSRHEKWQEIIKFFGHNHDPILVKSCQNNKKDNCNECLQCIRNIISLTIENENPSHYGHSVERDWFERIRNDIERGMIELEFSDIIFFRDMQFNISNTSNPYEIDNEIQDFLNWFSDMNPIKFSNLEESDLNKWKLK